MKKLMLTIAVVVITAQAYAMRYQTISALPSAPPRQTHTINQYDQYGMRGGGTFLWVTEPSTTVQTIPGLIYRSNNATDGYWIREEYTNGGMLRPEWFGANHVRFTLAAQGVTQAYINSMYPPGLINVTTDTYDDVALKYIYGVLILNENHNLIQFGSATYWHGNSTIWVVKLLAGKPRNIVSRGPSQWQAISNAPFTFLKQTPPDSIEDANKMVEIRWTFEDIYFKGYYDAITGATPQNILDIGPGNLCQINRCGFEGCEECIKTTFAMGTLTTHCRFGGFSKAINYNYTNSSWSFPGIGTTTSQSNMSSATYNRFHATKNAEYAISDSANNSFHLRNTYEGNGYNNCVVWDDAAGTTMRQSVELYPYIEVANNLVSVPATNGTITNGFLYARMRQGKIEIKSPYGQFDGAKGTWIASVISSALSANVSIADYESWVPRSGELYRNQGTSWNFDQCLLHNNAATIPNYFNNAGPWTLPSLCGGVGCGNNKFKFNFIPR